MLSNNFSTQLIFVLLALLTFGMTNPIFPRQDADSIVFCNAEAFRGECYSQSINPDVCLPIPFPTKHHMSFRAGKDVKCIIADDCHNPLYYMLIYGDGGRGYDNVPIHLPPHAYTGFKCWKD